jgi:hypothetical protein
MLPKFSEYKKASFRLAAPCRNGYGTVCIVRAVFRKIMGNENTVFTSSVSRCESAQDITDDVNPNVLAETVHRR